jgi:uncharacterized protein YbaP (TraB family)
MRRPFATRAPLKRVWHYANLTVGSVSRSPAPHISAQSFRPEISEYTARTMYFEIEGSTVRLAGTMHRVPKTRDLASWVPNAIDAARLIYIEHEEGASTQGRLASQWSPRLAQRLPRSWPRIESKFPRATTLQLNTLNPRALISCLHEHVDIDSGVEHLALARSRAIHSLRPRIEYLETTAELLALDDHVSDAIWDEAVSWVLDHPAASTTLLESSYDAWIAAEFDAIDRLSSTYSINRFAPIKETNIHTRNLRWLSRICELVKAAGESTLVLVGAAHLGGAEGLVPLLTASGVKLSRLS